jgi:hypothetical protein
MSNPIPGGGDEPQRRAEYGRQDAPSDERDGDRVSDDSENPRPDYEDSETALGGADSVEKTTWVVGSGTEPEAGSHGRATALTDSGSGINLGAWVVGLIAAAIALVYGFGLLR